jgi:2-polyprenyl-6-methoxyphenol hydroxylase-like FAD-dependent oxidoreductase
MNASTGHAVVIAGGGPTGLMLAGELALAGIDVAIVEQRVNQDLIGPRARGLHARTIEVFDQRGIADLAQGQVAQVAGFAWVRLDISDFPTRHPYELALLQHRIERILEEWVREFDVPIYRGREVSDVAQDDTGVDVILADGHRLRAEYLIGCDGGRSVVRKSCRIDFPGWDATTSSLIAEVEMTDEPECGIRRDALGVHSISRPQNGGPVQVLVSEPRYDRAGEPTLHDLSAALMAVYGTDYGVHSPTSISRFTDAARQAEFYRKGRVLLAGDAAHVHPPIGGQGLQIGVQDAVNLGWKLAQVVKGMSPPMLLDTYHSERHPIAALVLRNTMAQMVLLRVDDRIRALRDCVADLLSLDEARQRFAAMMSGLDVRYDLGQGHPLLGRRMPDLDITTANGPRRVFTLLHRARPLLLNLSEANRIDITSWADRVAMVDARCDGPWQLPVIGAVIAPDAVLIRPDGYVAWVGEGTQGGLADALTTWFGEPAA